MCYDSNPFFRDRIGMPAPRVQISKEPSIGTCLEHDLYPLQLWNKSNCVWFSPKIFQEQGLGWPDADPLAKERRLSWVVCFHSCSVQKTCACFPWAKCGAGIVYPRWQPGEMNRQHQRSARNNVKCCIEEEKTVMSWRRVHCLLWTTEDGRSPVMGMSKKPTGHRWE